MAARIGYVPGVFDLFHVGHLNALRFAREHCDLLVAGVVADEVCTETKGLTPYVPTVERREIVASLSIVDRVHVETTPHKLDAWQEVGFHLLFKGDDWRGTAKGRRLEDDMASVGVEVCYFPYTLHTSSTQLRDAIRGRAAVASATVAAIPG